MMVTGGNSLIMGFTERLNHDLAHKCPPVISTFLLFILILDNKIASFCSPYTCGTSFWRMDWRVYCFIFGYKF